ncbi:histidine kinase [Mucilaginibacter sp. 21P]|uniref:sensor histidine kinase n=1 Tax=Mucilaginibacter sp. 21P TaxID=2778902 RepID=UPI001C587645|nr:sensor histidine kinase [Mucilaginibacter sp. 21P]QXV63755.1 histidine kinase [Mucilaginibacter sp. 21P]
MHRSILLLGLICGLFTGSAVAQKMGFEKSRLTVSNGLPQSFISGLTQDKAGFIWIATRDGLSRFDGRQFKVFRHLANQKASLASNVITGIWLDRSQLLWIRYESGDIDLLNTITQKISHTDHESYLGSIIGKIRNIDRSVQDAKGRYWMLNLTGGVFCIDGQHKEIDLIDQDRLAKITGTTTGPVTGIAVQNGKALLITDQAIVSMNGPDHFTKLIPYRFVHPHLFDPLRRWKDNSPVIRPNGDIVIIDQERLIIYKSATGKFVTKTLPPLRIYTVPILAQRLDGSIVLGYDVHLFDLDVNDELHDWNEPRTKREVATSMLVDRSGVLWIGTNGYNLRQIDLRIPRFTGLAYRENFATDLIKKLNRDNIAIDSFFLKNLNPYFFRWAENGKSDMWIAKGGADTTQRPHLLHFSNGKMTVPQWSYADHHNTIHYRINALAVSPRGSLWALDHRCNLLRLDTLNHTANVVTTLGWAKRNEVTEINNMVMDGESVFFAATSEGLLRYDLQKNILHWFQDIPVSGLTVLINDPNNSDFLWAGTQGSGLLRLNKRNFSYRWFTTVDGLPNNTIYAILEQSGLLWCSTNKGIFSYNTSNGAIKSYSTVDGLPVDEFNRFHFFKLPGQELAFGGTDGYTIFKPSDLASDNFNTPVVLTGLTVSNLDANYGSKTGLLQTDINAVSKLTLDYRQNFLTFEFSALEYNIPEKITYRYQLIGLDRTWINAGAKNMATYTGLAPGDYVFKVQAANSGGTWSTNIKYLPVSITPPFWMTWWFKTLCAFSLVAVIYALLSYRVANVRRQEAQKHRFASKLAALEEQALRAQMNPHFIFNCLNSIKALIQESKNQDAVVYLTAFSKLIRAQLNNSPQELSLNDELQTCRLYLKMEGLRFGERLHYEIHTDFALDDLKITIPPLLLQPLVENAIWHGVLPLEKGGAVKLSFERVENGVVKCVIDDNGVGRAASGQIRSKRFAEHQSRGMQLVEDRIYYFNQTNRSWHLQMSVQDKKDLHDKSLGTAVILTFTPLL